MDCACPGKAFTSSTYVREEPKNTDAADSCGPTGSTITCLPPFAVHYSTSSGALPTFKGAGHKFSQSHLERGVGKYFQTHGSPGTPPMGQKLGAPNGGRGGEGSGKQSLSI